MSRPHKSRSLPDLLASPGRGPGFLEHDDRPAFLALHLSVLLLDLGAGICAVTPKLEYLVQGRHGNPQHVFLVSW